MRTGLFRAPFALAGGTAVLLTGALVHLTAQAPPPAGQGGGRGGGRGGLAPALFSAFDANKDGAVSRDEFTGAFDKWFGDWDTAKTGSLSAAEIGDGLTRVTAAYAPAPPPGGGQDACGGRSANPHVACQSDVDKMMAALPDKAMAKPLKPRKVLVLGAARGFVHSSIPLAAKTIEEMGKKTGAWTATTTYDAADINSENLKQYDLIFLDSTTGCFLDDPADPAATAARRAALLEFIRGGKGIAGIHAATDSYHGASCGGGAAAPAGRGRAGGRAGGPGGALATAMVAQGDKDGDEKLSRAEFTAVTAAWWDKLDIDKAGRIAQADFAPRFAALTPAPAPRGGGRAGAEANAAQGKPGGDPLWPEFNTMIGGYFKFHWVDPQEITVKIDDPKSPLTQMFHGQEWVIHDETYTFNQDSFSRTNVHVLTSIDYDKMSDVDKAKESGMRTDHDYALSWIRREGKGRLFYEAHGHAERNYAIKPFLEHILAGVQYALGDLKVEDTK
ncbi:MAG TPA: ThuA domain-containing protein [Vicinamibacterales bacterium]|jgi:type 1 glutamine amidotransferase